MGKGAPPPKAPDPYETASAESQFNRLDTYGPTGGGVRHGFTNNQGEFKGGVAPEGKQSAQMLLESDTERRIREMLEPASRKLVRKVIGQNINKMPNAAKPQNFDRVADQLYETGYNRMAPTFEAENDRMLANLQARGIPIGSEAFGDAYSQQQRGVNDALSDLSMRATQMAGAEQTRQFGIDSARRQNTIAELTAAMGGGYNPPSALPSGDAASVDYGGMVQNKYNADLDMWKYKQEQTMNTASAVGSLAGALFTKSDRRAKTDIVLVGEREGLRVYGARYHDDPPGTMRICYMAQEVAETKPEAVGMIGPWLALDYSQLPSLEANV